MPNVMPDAQPASQYEIEVPAFTGPLDLLLHLIEREQLDITAISLARVTAQYLAQVRQLQEQRIDQLIDFIVIGARLVLIKSRALLPQAPRILPEESVEEEDPAEALARQLRRYKLFRQAATWLEDRETGNLRTYLRVAPPPRPDLPRELDLTNVDAGSLRQLLMEVLSRMEESEASVAIVEQRQMTIEGQMGHLRRLIRSGKGFDFRQLLSGTPTRVELAVTLLAVLELMKQREVQAVQERPFGPIEIRESPGRNGQPSTTA
jgi:segregation and condensation protein A